MIGIPLPERLARHLASPGGNLSLFYDRGFAGHGEGAQNGSSAKERFLEAFQQVFAEQVGTGRDLVAFTERRERAMKAIGAEAVYLVNHSRLVVGLGLPSPLETGFLLDRLTGYPYLPGSSVKGLARATASLVAAGELDGDAVYWQENQERIFGPAHGEGSTPAKGQVVFYDAFPRSGPRLAVDVLTPHFRDYYSDGSIPGDWGEPVPVPFLTVEVGTEIAFYFQVIDVRSADDDVTKLTALLEQGLEQLGIGGKRSSGYGVFSSEPAPVVQAAIPAERKNGKRPPEAKTAAKSRGDSLWTNAQLARGRSGIEANRGKRRASGDRDLVDKKTWSALKKGKKVVADVSVARVLEEYRIIKVKNVRF